MNELNELLAANQGQPPSNLNAHLSTEAAKLFNSLPSAIAQQLLMDRGRKLKALIVI